jgi:hypothetical protein
MNTEEKNLPARFGPIRGWQFEGTTTFIDQETGNYIHDPKIELSKALTVKRVTVVLNKEVRISSEIHSNQTYTAVKRGEEAIYIGKEFKTNTGEILVVTGFEYEY